MNKLLVFLLFVPMILSAQEESNSLGKNEVRIDALSAIAFSKMNVSYEHFLNDDFSVGITFGYADSKKVNDDFDKGFRTTLPKYDAIPYLRYNLSKGQSRFYFAEVFAAANSGEFRETIRDVNSSGNAYYTIQKSDYFDIALGAGLGYKMYFADKFAAEFLVGFGTNLIGRATSPDVISRVGLNIGYRF